MAYIIMVPSFFPNSLKKNTKYSVPDGMKELKAALENGEIVNYEDAKYSNFASARDLELN